MSSRGNSLMVSMIAIAVLMVLVVGAIRFTGTNREAAASKIKGDQMIACAETARRYLLSRLRVFGIQVQNIQLDPTAGNSWATLPDDPVPARRTVVGQGHYEQGPTSGAITIAAIASNSMGSSRFEVDDAANRVPGSLAGSYYRVVMMCREGAGGRESEVEFVFRYGL